VPGNLYRKGCVYECGREWERKIVYTLLTFPFKGFNKCNQVIKATNLCGTSTELAFKIKTLTDVPS
jgi:hypothetical protein